MSVSLFVFAHQDDEIATASRIVFELECGNRVHCAFLTDGGEKGSRRDLESLKVLGTLGVDPDSVHFLGREIPDGLLVENLDAAFEALEVAVEELEVGVVITLAREGGHQDHDAAHLVALAVAATRRVECFEMPLYHGAGLPGLFFRVMSPRGEAWTERRVSRRQGLRHLWLVRHYRSQRRSWLGLTPEGFVKLVVLRREYIRRVDPRRCSERPHDGALYFERGFKYPYAKFEALAHPFIEQSILPALDR